MEKKKTKVQASVRFEPSPAKEYTSPQIHTVGVKIVAEDNQFLPVYKSAGAACADLKANLPDGPVRLPHRAIATIECGFAMEMPTGYKALISLRSSMGERGLVIPNSPGVIDSDYRGTIKVTLANVGREIVLIEHGERFAQIRIEPVYVFEWMVVDDIAASMRDVGGFGSTGKK